ncbi:MAG: galactose mutarotase [Gemmataceae bacterium]|nr:galactose mutarotase [Gemmataceae bacterium]
MRRGVILAGVLLPALLVLPGGAQDRKPEKKVAIAKSAFGKTKAGAEVDAYTLTNAHGVSVRIITYGAAIQSLAVPDKSGKFDDVTLGFDTIKGYQLAGNPYFGCIVGRYANRIADGKFKLNGKEYELAKNNDKKHHLHGGTVGFDKAVWEWKKQSSLPGTGPRAFVEVTFAYTSLDKEEGYPGELRTQVTYGLNNANELTIKYEATTDQDTIVNLTNHAYFNLAGAGKGDILGHELTLFASKYTPADATLIPTGKIEPVAGTPFDFLKAKKIGKDIGKVRGGYDLNFVIDKGKGDLKHAARVVEPKSGRVMDMYTTEPGVQFYTGNFLDGSLTGKGGKEYAKHAGFCLEAQKYPDSPNKPEFPSPVLKKGETYKQTTVYKFTTAK